VTSHTLSRPPCWQASPWWRFGASAGPGHSVRHAAPSPTPTAPPLRPGWTSDSRNPGSGVGSPKEVGTPPLPVSFNVTRAPLAARVRMKRFSCVSSRAKGYNPDLRLHPKERRFLGGSSTLFRCACIRVHHRGALGTAWRAANKEGSSPPHRPLSPLTFREPGRAASMTEARRIAACLSRALTRTGCPACR